MPGISYDEMMAIRGRHKRVLLLDAKTNEPEVVFTNVLVAAITLRYAVSTVSVLCRNNGCKDGYKFMYAHEYENKHKLLLPGAMVELPL